MYMCVNICLLECIKIRIILFSIFGGENIVFLFLFMLIWIWYLSTVSFVGSVIKVNVIKNLKTPVLNGNTHIHIETQRNKLVYNHQSRIWYVEGMQRDLWLKRDFYFEERVFIRYLSISLRDAYLYSLWTAFSPNAGFNCIIYFT